MNENNTNGNPSDENQNLPQENNGSPEASSETQSRPVTEINPQEHSSVATDGAQTESPEEQTPGEETVSVFHEFFSEDEETSVPKMTETLKTFLQLRVIDEELSEIEEEKGDLPDTIANIKEKIENLQESLDGKNELLSGLGEEKEKLLSDNKSHEDKINKYDEQKYNVRNNSEYDEINKAIDSLFEEVKKNETRIAGIGEETGKLTADTASLTEKIEALSQELVEKQSLLDELNEQYKQDEQNLRERRKAFIDRLDESSSQLYERINSSHKGEATAIVRKGNCSGCFNSIPPQRVIEIKSAEKIFTCQSCGRILISEELANQQ